MERKNAEKRKIPNPSLTGVTSVFSPQKRRKLEFSGVIHYNNSTEAFVPPRQPCGCRANGVEQISVQGSAIFASYHRRLRVDETFLLQLPHILCHRIFTHADRMADGFVTGVALVGLTILAPEQIGIDGDLTKIQTDAEYLIWYHKIVFLCAALGPFVETQFIPPVLS